MDSGRLEAREPSYFERQSLQRCLQHSLNNLFQRPAFAGRDLDSLANQLAPGRTLQPLFHPHRTLLLGNWDVNVLELALRRQGKELQWHDLRDVAFERLDPDACFGIILNVKGDGMVTRMLGGRHWIALRRLGGHWWNLDSTLPAPQLVAACCSGGEAEERTGSCTAAAGTAIEEAAAAAAATPAEAAQETAATEDAAAGGVPMAGAARTGPIGVGPAAGGEAGGEAGGARGEAATAAVADAAAKAAGASGAVTAQGPAGAAEAAALRRFLAEQVQLRDAKVFRIAESPPASHPLPPDDNRMSTAAVTMDS